MLTATLRRPQTIRGAQDTTERLFSRQTCITAGCLLLGAILIFVLLDIVFGINPIAPSTNPYFTYQAWSWLHGRWDITVPGDRTDLIMFNGKLYSVSSPFPAIMLVPFVALFGTNVSDVFFTIVVSAIDLALLFLLFEQLRINGFTQRSWRESLLWAVLLYFGSEAVCLSLGGAVWWIAHIVSLGCTLLALLLAFRRRYVWAAVALGCAFLTRSTLLLGFVFLLYLAWQDDGGIGGSARALDRFVMSLRARRPDWSQVPWRRLSAIVAVGAAAVALYLARNYAMFGNPLESGYSILNAQQYPMIKHGLFSIVYVPSNIVDSFFAFPHIYHLTTYSHHVTLDMMNAGTGISIFLTTPLFLLLFWRNRHKSQLRAALWVSLFLMGGFVLLYYTAGYKEFGTRYLFDFYPFAWVLLLLSEVRTDWRVVVLGLVAIIINFLGAFQFWTGIMPHF